jgi:hypothetical protein
MALWAVTNKILVMAISPRAERATVRPRGATECAAINRSDGRKLYIYELEEMWAQAPADAGPG